MGIETASRTSTFEVLLLCLQASDDISRTIHIPVHRYFRDSQGRFGYWQPPHAEVDIVHGGYQALPLSYDNDGTLFDGTDGEITGLALYSEAQRVWEVPQDWTVKGVELLTLWFYGGPGNAVEPFYVALEDSAGNRKEVEHPNPAAVTIERWEQWAIPLVDFAGVDMRTVKMMGIGVGDPTSNQPSGTGLVRVDDIELHLP